MFENLIQYSTSGVAQFMQRGAIAALDEGDAFLATQVERAQAGARPRLPAARRDRQGALQRAAGRVLSVLHGRRRSRIRAKAAFDIVDKANVGLAPGTAFGAGGEGFLQALLPPPPRPARGSRATGWRSGSKS